MVNDVIITMWCVSHPEAFGDLTGPHRFLLPVLLAAKGEER